MANLPDPTPSNVEAGQKPTPFAQVPDHEMIQVVGRGGGGEVWLAKNALGSYRAVKIVYEATFRHRRPFDREFNGVKKFEPISRLHDGLMDVLQVGREEAGGYFYCVMELADDVKSGREIDPKKYAPRTLAADVARTPRLPTSECLRIGMSIAAALKFLHDHGLIHRDIKPSNIVFVNDVPKLADVGLVAELAEAKSFVGTDGFIPPEGPGTVQADVYSLGKVLYEISTGKDRRDYPELPTQFSETVHERELVELNKIILKACRPDPRDRYGSAAAMMEDLLAVQGGGVVKVRHAGDRFVRKAGWAVVATALLGLVAWAIIPSGQKGAPGVPNLPLLPSDNDKPPVAAAVPSGLMGWWPAEDDTIDSVSGTAALLLNGATMVPEGKVGRAFAFDGVDDHVRISDRPELRFTRAMTVEGWVYPTRNDASQNILTKWDAIAGVNQRSYAFGCFPRGRVYFSVEQTGGDREGHSAASTTQLPTNQWSHVAGVYDGRHLKVYINGTLEGQSAYSSGIFPGTSDLTIGGCAGGVKVGKVVSPFAGRVDELSLYQRDLSEAEIREIYEAGSLGKKPSPPLPVTSVPAGLIGWWRAEGDARDVMNRHDGTLMNGASFAFGKTGQAFSFDGKDDYVMVPWAADLDVGRELTVEFWMKADPANFMDDCCQGLVSTDFYAVEISHSYTLVPGVNLTVITDVGIPLATLAAGDPKPAVGNTAETNGAAAVVSPGEWHHIAATYDGAGLQLYIDGSAWGKRAEHTGAIFPMMPGSFLTFGSQDGRSFCPACAQRRYFKGLLDEVRIFSRVLSNEEIGAAFKSGQLALPEVANAARRSR